MATKSRTSGSTPSARRQALQQIEKFEQYGTSVTAAQQLWAARARGRTPNAAPQREYYKIIRNAEREKFQTGDLVKMIKDGLQAWRPIENYPRAERAAKVAIRKLNDF